MHIIMASLCKCAQIKFKASSKNYTPMRTLPRVKDLSQEGKAIENETFRCKFEFPCIVKGPLLGPLSIAHDLGLL